VVRGTFILCSKIELAHPMTRFIDNHGDIYARPQTGQTQLPMEVQVARLRGVL
jgi:hypothetical protein